MLHLGLRSCSCGGCLFPGPVGSNINLWSFTCSTLILVLGSLPAVACNGPCRLRRARHSHDLDSKSTTINARLLRRPARGSTRLAMPPCEHNHAQPSHLLAPPCFPVFAACRQFTVQEMELLAAPAGLEIVTLYGDMAMGVDLSHEEAHRMVVVLKKV